MLNGPTKPTRTDRLRQKGAELKRSVISGLKTGKRHFVPGSVRKAFGADANMLVAERHRANFGGGTNILWPAPSISDATLTARSPYRLDNDQIKQAVELGKYPKPSYQVIGTVGSGNIHDVNEEERNRRKKVITDELNALDQQLQELSPNAPRGKIDELFANAKANINRECREPQAKVSDWLNEQARRFGDLHDKFSGESTKAANKQIGDEDKHNNPDEEAKRFANMYAYLDRHPSTRGQLDALLASGDDFNADTLEQMVIDDAFPKDTNTGIGCDIIFGERDENGIPKSVTVKGIETNNPRSPVKYNRQRTVDATMQAARAYKALGQRPVIELEATSLKELKKLTAAVMAECEAEGIKPKITARVKGHDPIDLQTEDIRKEIDAYKQKHYGKQAKRNLAKLEKQSNQLQQEIDGLEAKIKRHATTLAQTEIDSPGHPDAGVIRAELNGFYRDLAKAQAKQYDLYAQRHEALNQLGDQNRLEKFESDEIQPKLHNLRDAKQAVEEARHDAQAKLDAINATPNLPDTSKIQNLDSIPNTAPPDVDAQAFAELQGAKTVLDNAVLSETDARKGLDTHNNLVKEAMAEVEAKADPINQTLDHLNAKLEQANMDKLDLDHLPATPPHGSGITEAELQFLKDQNRELKVANQTVTELEACGNLLGDVAPHAQAFNDKFEAKLEPPAQQQSRGPGFPF